MKVITKILDILEKIAKIFTASVLGIMLVVSLVEIVRRYFIGHSSMWSDEFVRYCIVMVAMIGGAACFRDGELVAFDLLKTHLYGKVRLTLELIINTIVLVFCAFILRNAVATLRMPSIVMQISVGIKVSMFWFYLPIAIGLALICIFAVEAYPKLIKAYRNGDYDRKNKPISNTTKKMNGGE